MAKNSIASTILLIMIYSALAVIFGAIISFHSRISLIPYTGMLMRLLDLLIIISPYTLFAFIITLPLKPVTKQDYIFPPLVLLLPIPVLLCLFVVCLLNYSSDANILINIRLAGPISEQGKLWDKTILHHYVFAWLSGFFSGILVLCLRILSKDERFRRF